MSASLRCDGRLAMWKVAIATCWSYTWCSVCLVNFIAKSWVQTRVTVVWDFLISLSFFMPRLHVKWLEALCFYPGCPLFRCLRPSLHPRTLLSCKVLDGLALNLQQWCILGQGRTSQILVSRSKLKVVVKWAGNTTLTDEVCWKDLQHVEESISTKMCLDKIIHIS